MVRLQDKVSILLSTEKPLYQPGQTIHARALALDRTLRASGASLPPGARGRLVSANLRRVGTGAIAAPPPQEID